MSSEEGKRGLVELRGTGSTGAEEAPNINFKRVFNFKRIDFDYFSYMARANGQNCSFKIDTGSDVSILNRKIVKGNEETRGEKVFES